MPLVCDVFWHHKRRYGARRIAMELRAKGQPCGVDRVAKLLKMQGLQAIQPQPFKPRTTNSRHTLGYSPNLLQRSSPPVQLNRIWVADITYIPLQCHGFAYLALVLDLCSRRVVGWSLAEHMTETLVLDALQHAIRARQPPPNLVHHSDRGGQYASQAYRGLLRRAGMQQSMSRAANCYDNAFMESCFGTIKTELEMTEYQHSRQARSDIASYLAYYNTERLHSSLEYLSPTHFEARLTKNVSNSTVRNLPSSSGCMRFRPDSTVVSPRYLLHTLGRPDVMGIIAGRAQGAIMPNLNLSILADVPLVLPPATTSTSGNRA